MASSDKKVRKANKKRERAKREAERQKRRQLRSQTDSSSDENQFADPAHVDLFDDVAGESFDQETLDETKALASNPAITDWWNRYLEAGGSQRLSMVREKLAEDLAADLDEDWREAMFPQAVYECEVSNDASDYAALLETMAAQHRQLYELGLLWFLRSRVRYYLSLGNTLLNIQRIDDAVSIDAATMKETGEAFYGTVSMLRLAGHAGPADTLAEAGFRLLDESDLMPWAVDVLFHFFMDSHVRQCVADGGDAAAITRLESVFNENDGNMEEAGVLLRAEIIRRLTGKTKTKWVPNQLLGTNQRSAENRYLLGFEFAHWLTSQRGIPAIAADELRGLLLETFSSDGITMRSYFDVLSQTALDKHLAGMLGFMSLDRFKAPATLIAVEHFVSFLHDAGLAKPKAVARSITAIHNLDGQLRRVLDQEWSSFTFLDPLRTFANPSLSERG